jgi:hypothetical protein
LTAPSGQAIPAQLDLSALGQREISLGPNPNAELHLAQGDNEPTPTARLVARRGPDGQTGVILMIQAGDQSGQTQVNGLPIADEWPLQDGDMLTLGAWRFRYENLRRRASNHRPTNMIRKGEI